MQQAMSEFVPQVFLNSRAEERVHCEFSTCSHKVGSPCRQSRPRGVHVASIRFFIGEQVNNDFVTLAGKVQALCQLIPDCLKLRDQRCVMRNRTVAVYDKVSRSDRMLFGSLYAERCGRSSAATDKHSQRQREQGVSGNGWKELAATSLQRGEFDWLVKVYSSALAMNVTSTRISPGAATEYRSRGTWNGRRVLVTNAHADRRLIRQGGRDVLDRASGRWKVGVIKRQGMTPKFVICEEPDSGRFLSDRQGGLNHCNSRVCDALWQVILVNHGWKIGRGVPEALELMSFMSIARMMPEAFVRFLLVIEVDF